MRSLPAGIIALPLAYAIAYLPRHATGEHYTNRLGSCEFAPYRRNCRWDMATHAVRILMRGIGSSLRLVENNPSDAGPTRFQ
jgi:hypothetical protein